MPARRVVRPGRPRGRPRKADAPPGRGDAGEITGEWLDAKLAALRAERNRAGRPLTWEECVRVFEDVEKGKGKETTDA
jgi:hypothetical protein